MAAACTIGSLIRDSGLQGAEAELLLGAILGCNRAQLIAHPERPVGPADEAKALAGFARRRRGEPVAYITGRREFYAIELAVSADVLIPRPETEQLVDLALERLPAEEALRVLDLGTGSGAIAIALARSRPAWRITASDVSPAALGVARANARRSAVSIDFLKSDWFDAVPPGRFDLIASNPPYVAAGDPHLRSGDVRFEPVLALVGGTSGMECLERIATLARDHLRPGGWLMLEHGYDQGERCLALLTGLGYAQIDDVKDLSGIPRVCAGRRRG